MKGKWLAFLILFSLGALFIAASAYKVRSQVRFAKRMLHAKEAPAADSVKARAADKARLQDRMADSLISYASRFMGTGYCAGGATPQGFDCSGFTSYIFQHYGFDVPHGSASQINVGKEVPLAEARKGDLLIFTGTNPAIREPGHVGIVIDNNKPVRFIHSSSNGGVKISQVDSTRYAVRFLQVRRIL